MFLLKFKKVSKLLSRAFIFSWLLCLFGGVVSAAEINKANESRSKTYVHKTSSGGKATETMHLSKPEELPEGRCALFVSAKVEYDEQRFGKAKVISRPRKNCNPDLESCKVTVEWAHSPVGFVHYWVRAKWNVKSTGC